jgi:hypothetical protein
LNRKDKENNYLQERRRKLWLSDNAEIGIYLFKHKRSVFFSSKKMLLALADQAEKTWKKEVQLWLYKTLFTYSRIELNNSMN